MKTEVVALDDSANQINSEHHMANAATAKAVQHALNAGDLLLEAKKSVSHGGWIRSNILPNDVTPEELLKTVVH